MCSLSNMGWRLLLARFVLPTLPVLFAGMGLTHESDRFACSMAGLTEHCWSVPYYLTTGMGLTHESDYSFAAQDPAEGLITERGERLGSLHAWGPCCLGGAMSPCWAPPVHQSPPALKSWHAGTYTSWECVADKPACFALAGP